MAEINPPTYTEDGCTTAQQDRLILSSLVCSAGIRAAGDLAVTDAGDGDLRVSAGSAFIEGDQVTDQGLYHVTSDGPVILTPSPSDPTDDRIDLVVAQVHDAQFSGDTSEWELVIVEGMPSPSPTAPEAPPNSLVLAQVRVNAGSTSLTITDRRVVYRQCRGAYGLVQGVDVYRSGTGWSSGPDTNNAVHLYVHPERDRVDCKFQWRRTGAPLSGDFADSVVATLHPEWQPPYSVMVHGRANGTIPVMMRIGANGEIVAGWAGGTIQTSVNQGYNLWVTGTWRLTTPYLGPLPPVS